MLFKRRIVVQNKKLRKRRKLSRHSENNDTEIAQNHFYKHGEIQLIEADAKPYSNLI